MAENKRVGYFTLAVMLVLLILGSWLALITPQYTANEVTHDIALRDLLDS